MRDNEIIAGIREARRAFAVESGDAKVSTDKAD